MSSQGADSSTQQFNLEDLSATLPLEADKEVTGTGDSTTAEDEEERANAIRDAYDQAHHFVEVPRGLLNQVYRQGLIPKKAGKDGYIRMRGSRRYHRE